MCFSLSYKPQHRLDWSVLLLGICFFLPYKPQHMLDWSITGKLSLLISSHTCAQQISRHRVAVVRALAVNMGWHVNQCSCHVGTGPLEERGHAAGLVVTSPDGARSVYDTVFVVVVVVVVVVVAAVLDILYDYIDVVVVVVVVFRPFELVYILVLPCY